MKTPSRDMGASLHHQVFAVIRSGIMSGRYGDGDFLPSEEVLTETFGVSRATIRRALLSLEQEGLIERRQGRGTRVTWQGRGEPVVASFSNHLDRIGERDPASSVRVLSFERVNPPEAARNALGLGRTEPAWRLVRLREQASRPLWMIVTYFPQAIGDALAGVPFETTSLFNALKAAGCPCVRAEELVGATLADPVVAAEIGVKIGSPLLELARVLYDGSERPLSFQMTLVPPERRKLRLVIHADENGLTGAGVLAAQAG